MEPDCEPIQRLQTFFLFCDVFVLTFLPRDAL